MGTGLYSKKLGLKEWDHYMEGVRIQANHVENLPYVLVLPPITGIFFPLPTIVMLGVNLCFRILYMFVYQYRGAAFPMIMLTNLGFIVLAFWTAAIFIQYGGTLPK